MGTVDLELGILDVVVVIGRLLGLVRRSWGHVADGNHGRSHPLRVWIATGLKCTLKPHDAHGARACRIGTRREPIRRPARSGREFDAYPPGPPAVRARVGVRRWSPGVPAASPRARPTRPRDRDGRPTLPTPRA